MSDYVNIYDYEDDEFPFQIFTGGRGTGKTYGALEGIVDGRRSIFMRRTMDEVEMLADDNNEENGNPFKPINLNRGTNIGLKRVNKKLFGIYHRTEEDDKLQYVGKAIGLACAMSTVAKVRGAAFNDYTDIIYDEFIPEKHIKKMRGECDAFLNAYETMNRNREFDGIPPMKAWLLSNANDIYNPIFVGLGIVSTVEKMARKGQTDLYMKERGLAIHLLEPSKTFVEKKSKTAIARLTKGSKFADSAYGNEFAYNDFTNVTYRKLVGYIPVAAVDNFYIYRKKGEKEIYVSYSPAKCIKFSSDIQADCMRFRREVGVWLQPYYVAGNMYFESYEIKEMILSLLF